MGRHKQYLGDGAYVQEGSYVGEFILTTEDGVSVQNVVVLGPVEIENLLMYLAARREAHDADEDDGS
jgi:hypothetical protein